MYNFIGDEGTDASIIVILQRIPNQFQRKSKKGSPCFELGSLDSVSREPTVSSGKSMWELFEKHIYSKCK